MVSLSRIWLVAQGADLWWLGLLLVQKRVLEVILMGPAIVVGVKRRRAREAEKALHGPVQFFETREAAMGAVPSGVA